MEYEHLTNLEVTPTNNWTIKIRVARKWNEMNSDNGEVTGIHMVFIDEYVSSPLFEVAL